MGSRASVNLHTHIFFRNQRRDETGYVLFVRQNAIQVLIPKYGLEGTLFLRREGAEKKEGKESCAGPVFVFDEEVPSQTCGDVVLRLFMEVTVQLSLDSSNVQHEKLALRLVRPNIEGLSVEPTPASAPMETAEGSEEKKKTPKKRSDQAVPDSKEAKKRRKR